MIKDVRKHWTKKAEDNLVGCQIVKVEYMPDEELKEAMWYRSPLCMLLKRQQVHPCAACPRTYVTYLKNSTKYLSTS